MPADPPLYALLDTEGRPYPSTAPGTFGGHRRGRIYGRLECPTALRALANGGYVSERVFFADEVTAITAGYRPCAKCLPKGYSTWIGMRRLATSSAALCTAYKAATRLQDRFLTDDPGSVVLGTSRDPVSQDAARVLHEYLLDREIEVPAVVDWPDVAASWRRQATRFAALAPDLWVVLVAEADAGWPRMQQRLRDTEWDPDRTLVITRCS